MMISTTVMDVERLFGKGDGQLAVKKDEVQEANRLLHLLKAEVGRYCHETVVDAC